MICYMLDTCDHLGRGEEPLLSVDGFSPPNHLKHTYFARPIGVMFSFFVEGMKIKIGLKPPPPFKSHLDKKKRDSHKGLFPYLLPNSQVLFFSNGSKK